MKKRESVSITIRLPTDLVAWIDKQIDDVENRSRTQVILKAIVLMQDSIKGKKK
jgi:Arc/MetJ-type ribon-helix-helix transcriptional regulator